MRHAYKILGLWLLLLVAQQGAVVHELSHAAGFVGMAELSVDAGSVDAACALCPVYAQVATPAFSHSFHVPLLVRVATQLVADRIVAAADTAVPTPRSRGPPART
jgi:hypothetical protein